MYIPTHEEIAEMEDKEWHPKLLIFIQSQAITIRYSTPFWSYNDPTCYFHNSQLLGFVGPLLDQNDPFGGFGDVFELTQERLYPHGIFAGDERRKQRLMGELQSCAWLGVVHPATRETMAWTDEQRIEPLMNNGPLVRGLRWPTM